MDALVWNNSDLVREFPSDEYLLTALNKIERRLAESGCVVCEVFVNGNKIPEESEVQFLGGHTLVEVDDFKVAYQPIHKLVQHSFTSISDMIPKISHVSQRTAQVIQQGEHQQAAQLIVQIMESCYWLTETLSHLKGLFRLRQDLEFPSDAWATGEANLRTVVKAMLAALERGDFVLIADYLQGQLVQVLQGWQALSEQITHLLEAKDAQPPAASEKVGAE